MRLPWFSQRHSQRGATRRRRAAPLKVRRLERRRVLDAAVTDLVFAPADLDPSTAAHDSGEGTTITVSANATGTGALVYDWTLSQNGSTVEQGHDATFNFKRLDDGNYSLSLTVTDQGGDGTSATRTEEVVIHNVAPTLVVPLSQTIPEGVLNLSGVGGPPLGLYTDLGTFDTHTATVDWGDGSAIETPVKFAVPGAGSLGGTHTYTQEGQYTVTVSVVDNNGGAVSKSFTLTVVNVAPTATLKDIDPVNEGSSATVTFADQFDPNPADTAAGFRYAYDFDNDGTFDVGSGVYATSVADASQVIPASFFAEGPGTHTVRARIIDKDGGWNDYLTEIEIDNVAPQLVELAAVDNSIDEGQTATIQMTIDDPSLSDVFSVEVNWQDGDPADTISGLGLLDAAGTMGKTTYQWDAETRQLTVTHLYRDDRANASPDVYAVALVVRDDDLGTSESSVNIGVSNVAPSINSLTITTPRVEGQPATLAGTYLDAGVLDTHELDIDWDGNGTFDQTVTVSGGAFSVSRTYSDDNPTGVSDTFNVNVRLRDDDGGEAPGAVALTVNNVQPTLVVAVNQTVAEGAPLNLSGVGGPSLGLYVDPGVLDSHKTYVDWGDGSAIESPDTNDVPGAGSFGGTHTYADDGVYTVTVRIADDDMSGDFVNGVNNVDFVEKTFTVTVTNVIPTLVVAQNQTIAEGSPLNLSGIGGPSLALYVDPGVNDSHTTYVDWGDGSAIESPEPNAVPGAGSFGGPHTYADNGTYTVTVRIADNDMSGNFTSGVSGIDFVEKTFTVTVTNVIPTLVVAQNQTVAEGSPLNLSGIGGPSLALYVDPGVNDSHTTYVDWGDGSAIESPEPNDVPGAGSFGGTHTYADNGTYTVTVRIADDDMSGNFTSGVNGIDFVEKTFTVTVTNVIPTLVVAANQTVAEGSPLNLSGIGGPSLALYVDPGVLDSHTTYIDWGDGSAIESPDPNDVPGAGSFGGTHTYADNGVYTVTVRIADDDMSGNFTSGVNGIDFVEKTFTVTVSNVIPTLVVAQNQTIAEGSPLNLSGIGGPPLALYVDPGVLDTHTTYVNWGDGSPIESPMPFTAPGSGSFGGTHTYADNGTYTVTVRIADDDMSGNFTSGVNGIDFVEKTFTVTVTNVLPTLDVEPTATEVDEGAEIGFDAAFSDPGFDNSNRPGGPSSESFRYYVDWGDGRDQVPNSPVADINGGVSGPSTGTFDGSHFYADNGTYTVTVRLADDDMSGNFATGVAGVDFVEQTFTVTVNNRAPFISPVSNQVVNEGAEFSLVNLVNFTDPGFDNPDNPSGETEESFTYDVNWGDNRDAITNAAVADMNGGPGVSSSGTIPAAHVYADNGDYVVRVTVYDDDGGVSDVLVFTVTVNNVDPIVQVTAPALVKEGSSFDLIASFSDAGFDHSENPGAEKEEAFTYDINWGDNRHTLLNQAVVDINGGPGVTSKGNFTLNHIYADNGTYLVTVTVRDDDGGIDVFEFEIIVENVAPTLTLTDQSFSTEEGGTLTITDLGSFIDPGFNNPDLSPSGSVETFSYSIAWGDGMVDTGKLPATLTNGGENVFTTGTLGTLSHFYADNDTDGTKDNKYTVTVTLTDDDGGVSVQTMEVTVFNVNPTLQPLFATDIDANTGTTTLTLTFADPGADSFQIMIDWGDKLFLPNPEDRFVMEQAYAGSTPNTFVIVHQYLGPPDPIHPTNDIVISVKILDDDFGALNMVEPGVSNVESVTIKNPGIDAGDPLVVPTTSVPQLDLTTQPITVGFTSDQGGLTQLFQVPDVRGGGGETAATTERYLELRIVYPDGTESEGFKIKDEALADLRAFFKTLPDGRYRIYLIRTENRSERLVIDVDVRRGRVIDVTDDSEGTRDRPPVEESAPAAVPLEQNPLLEQPQGNTESSKQEEYVETTGQDDQSVSSSAILPLSLSLAALAAAEPWSRRVDDALAGADESAWQRLRRAGRRGRWAPLPKIATRSRLRTTVPLD